MPYLKGTITRSRVIIDGDNINATEREGEINLSFNRKVEIRDLTAPENRGGGSAQETPDAAGAA